MRDKKRDGDRIADRSPIDISIPEDDARRARRPRMTDELVQVRADDLEWVLLLQHPASDTKADIDARIARLHAALPKPIPAEPDSGAAIDAQGRLW